MNLTPATPIKLSDSKLNTLASAVENLITDLEFQSAKLFQDMDIWQRNYEAKPRQAQKNFPFQNASNIVVPLARIMVDSRTSSTWGAIFGQGDQLWTTKLQNHDLEDRAKQVEKYINWQADGNDFNARVAIFDWLQESDIHGSSVLAGNWRNNQQFVYINSAGSPGGVKAVPVSWNRGPILEHVPRRQMLWDTSYPSIAEAPAVVRQFAKTWPEIANMASNSDGWFNDVVEEVRHSPGMSGPGQVLKKTEDELDSRGSTPSAYELHDVREVHLSWPNLQALDINGSDLSLPSNMKVKTSLVDIVVTFHRQSGKILRLASQPYFYPGKPFFDTFFHKRPGRSHSVGMVKLIEGIQAGMTTGINQALDAQTRANAVWAKTNMRELLDQPMDPSRPIWDPTMKGFEAINLQGSDFGTIQLTQVLQAMAERLSGQADPAFGRETRLGGHSAPATTTLALLERGQTLVAPDRSLLTGTLGRAGEFVSTLNQQFETDEDGKITRVLGDIDGELVKDIYFPKEPIPTNYKFTIKGLDKANNPQKEIQTQIGIRDASEVYWDGVFKITEAMMTLGAQPTEMRPILAEAYAQGLRGRTQTFKRILNAADIDDTENFLLTLEDGGNSDQVIKAFRDRALASAGSEPPTTQPGAVGSAGGTPGNGQAGPLGIAG